MSTKLALTLIFALALVACSARTDLPPLPQVDTSRVLKGVKEQMDGARKLVESHPSDAAHAGRYGLVLATYGRDEAAEIMFSRARKLAPEKASWAISHAYVLRRMGRTEEALSAINAGLESNPEQIDLLVKQGELLFDLGRFDDASEPLKRALEQSPDYALARYYTGRIHSQREEYDLATKEFEDMLAKGVSAYEVHFHLATALRAAGDQKAAAAQQQLADASKRRTMAGYDPVNRKLNEFNVGDAPHVVRAAELFSGGKVQEAIDELLIAVSKNPDNINARTHLIRLYGQQRKVDEAKIQFESARKADSAMPQVYSNMGYAYQLNQQFAEAAGAYRTAIEKDPSDAGNYAELGYALLKTGAPEEAYTQFDKSLEIAPENRDLRFIYGTALFKDKQLERAIEVFTSALEPADQKGIMVRRSLAQAYLFAGNKAASIEQLKDAIGLAENVGNEAMITDLRSSLEKIEALPDPE